MRQVIVAMALAVASFPMLARAGVEWKVLASEADRLTVEVQVEDAQLTSLEGPTGPYTRVVVEGLYDAGDRGLPAVPSAGRWIALPPEATPRLEVEILDTQVLGTGRLAPVPTPQRTPNVGFGDPRLSENLLEGSAYSGFRHGRDQYASLGAASTTRRQHLVPLRVAPVLYDAASQRIELVRRARVTVRWDQGTTAPPALGDVDRIVSQSVLNPERVAQWRADSPRHRAMKEARLQPRDLAPQKRATGVSVFDPATLLSAEVRLRVDRTGLFRIRVSDLIDEFQLPATTTRQQVRIYQKRPSDPLSAEFPLPLTADVPFAFEGNPDPAQPISADDVILFYGFAPRDDMVARTVDGEFFPASMVLRPDNWNTANVYYLAAADPGADAWKRMQVQSLPASSGSPAAFFDWDETYETDGGYQDNPQDAMQPRYHINEFNVNEASTLLQIRHPRPGSALDLSWQSVSRVTTSTRNIEFSLDKDGTVIPLTTLNLGTPQYRTLKTDSQTISADAVGDGFVDFKLRRDTGTTMAVYLGSVSVAYEALFQATFDQAFFRTGQAGGDIDVEVTGFGRTDLLLFDVTDPHAPTYVNVNAINIPSDGSGGFTLSFRTTQGLGVEREYVATPASRITRLRTSDMELDTVPVLLDGSGTGALAPSQALAVGPAMFDAPMQRWFDWRRDHDLFGWNYSYVDIQEIYDQFSGGLKSPGAIKAAFEYAYVNWNAAAVLLVGDACENARGLGTTPGFDHVPSSLHLQTTFTEFELLSSDKWMVMFGTDSGFPDTLTKGPDMMIGRLPANDVAQLDDMLDKIFQYETPGPDDEWRRRSLWMADDAYSTDYFSGPTNPCYRRIGLEDDFGTSQIFTADKINACLDGVYDARTWILEDFTSVYRASCPSDLCDCRAFVQGETRLQAQPDLIARLNEGWHVVSYQGHANFNSLAHETIWQSGLNTQLNNAGKYFLFFGMGCHVTDFMQAREGGLNDDTGLSPLGPPIGERLVEAKNRGAIASYGSSGFEYLTPNRLFMEEIADIMYCQSRTTSTVLDGLPSQWVLSESLAQAELDVLAFGLTGGEEMMAQYNLLGDPLLRMDAAPPRVTITADGTGVESDTELLPQPGSTQVTLGINAVDESGVARVSITDSEGRDYSSLFAFTDGGADPQQRQGEIDLPIHAQGYTLTVDTFDGSYPDDRPQSFVFTIPFELSVTVDGQAVAEGSGEVGVGSSVVMDFVSPIPLTAGDIAAGLDGGTVSTPGIESQSADNREWRVSFNVTDVLTAGDQALRLTLAGDDTVFQLSAVAQDDLVVREHYPFPNPSAGEVRFVVDSTAPVAWAKLSVYDLRGRSLHHSEQTIADETRFVFAWDGLDNQGDELANGVYFYRIEVGDTGRSVRSDMGRVVFMR